MGMLKSNEGVFPVLVDFVGFKEILINEGWMTKGNDNVKVCVEMLFEYLFKKNEQCQVVFKFMNEKFVFVREIYEFLSSLIFKFISLCDLIKKFNRNEDCDEVLFKEMKSLNKLSHGEKTILFSEIGRNLLNKYFKINGQDYLNLVKLKLSNQSKKSFEDFIKEEKILDDFRIFWDLLLEKERILREKNDAQSKPKKEEIFRKIKLTTTEKKRGKRENLKILKAELKREKRKTKMALKSLNKKIEYIMEEDAKVYLQLKQNKFDKREVYLAYEDLKHKEAQRNKQFSHIIDPQNVFYNQELLLNKTQPKQLLPTPKHKSFNMHYLSPSPKNILNNTQGSSAFVSKRHCKSMCKMKGKLNEIESMAPDKNSYHYRYLLKKSLSLEKGRPKARYNKWLKKPEDIGNCGDFGGEDVLRGRRKRGDGFESEREVRKSFNSDVVGKVRDGGKVLMRRQTGNIRFFFYFCFLFIIFLFLNNLIFFNKFCFLNNLNFLIIFLFK
jgi:hypothetical protein